MKKIKAILFDLDGTLVDSTEFVLQAYEYTLAFHGLPVTTREKLSPMIGRGLHAIYTEIAPKVDPVLLSETHINFQKERLHLVRSYPFVLATIKKLKKLNIRLAIVTSRMKNTDETLKTAGLDPNLFEVIVTADDTTNIKPHPEAVLLALNKLKIAPTQAILVGDGIADIEMAKNAKVRTVGVTYGFGGQDIIKSKPDYVIDDLIKLPKVLGFAD